MNSEPQKGSIDIKLTRVGPGRSQGWTVFLGNEPIAYYDRDPLAFSQRFHVTVLPQSQKLGYHSVDTEDPLVEFTRQCYRLAAVRQLNQELPNVPLSTNAIETRANNLMMSERRPPCSQ